MVPFFSVAFANSANTAAMRNAEMTTGIEVYNKETGQVYGVSKVAAKEAIGLTCVSRVVISGGCLVAPPIVTAVLSKSKFSILFIPNAPVRKRKISKN